MAKKKSSPRMKSRMEKKPLTIHVKPRAYQPSKSALEADLHIDATPEELRQALVRSVVMEEDG